MTPCPTIACGLLVALLAGTAAAEESPPRTGGEISPAGPPAPVTSPPVSTGVACVVGAHVAELDESARATTTFVCDALRARRVGVGPSVDDAAGARAAYVVKLDQLGASYSLTVTYEEPVGTVRVMRATSVQSLPELRTLAPDLAAALTVDRPAEGPPLQQQSVAPAIPSAPPAVAVLRVEPPAPTHEGTPARDWRAVGYLGGFGDGSRSGGPQVGASFQYRAGPLVAGALLESGGELFGYSYWGAAALGGLGVRPVRSVRLELLGAIGTHSYTGVGRDWLFGSDPGASGTTAYVGGRATVVCIFGKRLGHFELGAYADFQDDLSRTRDQYDYSATGSGWFDGGGTSDHVIGTSRLGFGLEMGGTHDIF